MAIVSHLRYEGLNTHTEHTEVDCTYSVIVDDGRKYLQIDTYGSATRKFPGKKSQSIRFTAEAITQLKTILSKEF
jgi:hypothetical protein